MRSIIFIFSFLVLTSGCSYNKQKKSESPHFHSITHKLSTPLKINLSRLGSGNPFQLKATLEASDELKSLSSRWILVSPDGIETLIQTESTSKEKPLHYILTSHNIELDDPSQNYKIVLIIDAENAKTKFKKTQVYNSLYQEDIDRAKKDLLERSNH